MNLDLAEVSKTLQCFFSVTCLHSLDQTRRTLPERVCLLVSQKVCDAYNSSGRCAMLDQRPVECSQNVK